jgi:hypothetical protein
MEPISGTMFASDRKYRVTGSLEQQTANGNLHWRGSIMLRSANEIIPTTPNNLVRLELDDNRSGDFRISGITFSSTGRREYLVESDGQFG